MKTGNEAGCVCTADERIITFEGMELVSYPALEKLGFLKHAFTTRNGGVSRGCFESMNLSFTRGDEEAAVNENFRRVGAYFGVTPDRMVMAFQEHTASIRVVTVEDAGKGVTRPRDYTATDGLVTNVPGLLLGTFHADCAPVFIADPVNKAVAMVHSGWRGTSLNISAEALKTMEREYGTKPSEVTAVVGPCIGVSCYEVGPEFGDIFGSLYGYDCIGTENDSILRPGLNGKYYFDLSGANKRNLINAGVRGDNIITSRLCTFENDSLFYSHRRMGNARGNMCGFIMLV